MWGMTMWCINCIGEPNVACYAGHHRVEFPHIWFNRSLAQLKEGLSGLNGNAKRVLQEKRMLREKYLAVKLFFATILSAIDSRISLLSAREDSIEIGLEDLQNIPEFPQQPSTHDVVAARIKRMKELLGRFDYWSKEMVRETESNSRTNSMAAQTRVLNGMPLSFRTLSEESDICATVQAVVEMLASPKEAALVRSDLEAAFKEKSNVSPGVVPAHGPVHRTEDKTKSGPSNVATVDRHNKKTLSAPVPPKVVPNDSAHKKPSPNLPARSNTTLKVDHPKTLPVTVQSGSTASSKLVHNDSSLKKPSSTLPGPTHSTLRVIDIAEMLAVTAQGGSTVPPNFGHIDPSHKKPSPNLPARTSARLNAVNQLKTRAATVQSGSTAPSKLLPTNESSLKRPSPYLPKQSSDRSDATPKAIDQLKILQATLKKKKYSICPVCLRKFTSKKKRKQHVDMHHQNVSKDCSFCAKSFTNVFGRMTHEGQCKEKKREEVDAPTIPNDTKPTESACSEQQPQKPASNHVVLPTWFQNEDCQAVSSVMNHHQEPCLERNNPAKRVRLARGKFQCEFCKTFFLHARTCNDHKKVCLERNNHAKRSENVPDPKGGEQLPIPLPPNPPKPVHIEIVDLTGPTPVLPISKSKFICERLIK